MKCKQWTHDESWLPDGPDTNKMMEGDALVDCVKEFKRLTSTQREWWAEFTSNERKYRERWSSASDDYQKMQRKASGT